MAYRNTRDRLDPGTYHVYNQAIDGRALFRDDEDRQTFEGMMNRHLSATPQSDPRGRPYVSLRAEVRMSARNVLTTHFHLVLIQRVPGGIAKLIHRVLVAYTRYYHRKYGTSGPLFKAEYSAIKREGRKHVKYVIGYVQNNHKRLRETYRFSTHRLYLNPEEAPSWLDVGPTIRFFGGLDRYVEYIRDFNRRADLDAKLRLP